MELLPAHDVLAILQDQGAVATAGLEDGGGVRKAGWSLIESLGWPEPSVSNSWRYLVTIVWAPDGSMVPTMAHTAKMILV